MAAPGGVAEAVALVRAAVPDLDVRDATAVAGGWDSFVLDVNGEWIFRFGRRPRPKTSCASRSRFCRSSPTLCRQRSPTSSTLPRPRLPSPAIESTVGPLLPSRVRALAHRTLEGFLADDANFDFTPAVIHYDVGPTHLLVGEDGRLQGVIDWGDVAVGDPAADLAWALHGAGDVFARAFDAYPGASPELARRALFYHRLGPWHEVVHGRDTGDDAWIETGLAGVIERLPQEPGRGR